MPEALLNICKFLPSEPERDVLLPFLLWVSDLPGNFRLVLVWGPCRLLKAGESGMVLDCCWSLEGDEARLRD